MWDANLLLSWRAFAEVKERSHIGESTFTTFAFRGMRVDSRYNSAAARHRNVQTEGALLSELRYAAIEGRKGRTEADGRVSTDYCSHCYVDGKFTDPSLTAEQMVERVRAKMKDMHVPGFLAKSFTKDIPTLGRWAKG
jgi:Putative zinc ribbon domain